MTIMNNIYYQLFKHLANEYGLVLTESELQEICRIADEIKTRSK